MASSQSAGVSGEGCVRPACGFGRSVAGRESAVPDAARLTGDAG